MGNIDEWFQKMVQMGEADMPMEIGGKIMTPREYMRSIGRI